MYTIIKYTQLNYNKVKKTYNITSDFNRTEATEENKKVCKCKLQ